MLETKFGSGCELLIPGYYINFVKHYKGTLIPYILWGGLI